MKKRHIITIAGGLGSGKSTTAKLVATELKYPHHSGGDFMRAMAAERGVSLEELGVLAKNDSAIDQEIDQKQKEFMDTHDNFVIDSRLGWFLAPESFKVFLLLDPDVAATRVLKDFEDNAAKRKGEATETPKTVDEVKANQEKRVASERERYKKYYGIEDHYALENFDLVIDTGVHSKKEAAAMVVAGFNTWLAE